MKKTTKKLNKKEEAIQLKNFEKEYNEFIKEQKSKRAKEKEKELNDMVNNFLSDVVDDGTKKPSGPADINSYYSAADPALFYDPNSTYVPYVDPVVDLNDFNTQATISLDTGIKDELNDIKTLLKSMNDNLDKIVHHLNGGWN